MTSDSHRGFDAVVHFDDERRDDSSCRRDTSDVIAMVASSSSSSTAEDSSHQYQYQLRGDVACTNPPYYCSGNNNGNSTSKSISTTTSIRSISKDMIRTFQSTIQNNSRSHTFMPENAPVSPMLQPRLQKLACDTRRIVQSVHQNAIVEGVSDTFANVNDRLGSMLWMRSKSTGATASLSSSSSTTTATTNIDRGIYSSQSMRSWGCTVTAEISTFTSQKLVPLFQRQNTYPFTSSNQKEKQHVSFDYQLMKDNE